MFPVTLSQIYLPPPLPFISFQHPLESYRHHHYIWRVYVTSNVIIKEYGIGIHLPDGTINQTLERSIQFLFVSPRQVTAYLTLGK